MCVWCERGGCPAHQTGRPLTLTPAEPARRRPSFTDAGAQLGAAFDQLQRALFELLLPAAEAIAGALGRLLDGRRAARRRRALDQLGRACAEGMAAGLDAGRQLADLGGRRPAGAIVTPARVELLQPAGSPSPEIGQLPAGYAEGDLHPSHEWELITAERAECQRCGACTCCDGARIVAAPCDVT